MSYGIVDGSGRYHMVRKQRPGSVAFWCGISYSRAYVLLSQSLAPDGHVCPICTDLLTRYRADLRRNTTLTLPLTWGTP